MKIRPMKIDDYEEVVAVWQATGLSVDDYDDSWSRLKQLIDKNRGGCLVAVSEGQIVGAVLGTYNGQRAWVYHLAVMPEYQRLGIGKALIAKLEQWCQKVGAKKIKLAVLKANNQALGFYEKLGYVADDDAITLEKSLIGGDESERRENNAILSFLGGDESAGWMQS